MKTQASTVTRQLLAAVVLIDLATGGPCAAAPLNAEAVVPTTAAEWTASLVPVARMAVRIGAMCSERKARGALDGWADRDDVDFGLVQCCQLYGTALPARVIGAASVLLNPTAGLCSVAAASKSQAMKMSHRYAVGEAVRLREAGFSHDSVSRNHMYEITRLMPPDQGGEYAYRLKSDAGERVARENEILGKA